MAFQYFISRKEKLAVVNLQGDLTVKDEGSLTKCMDELAVDKPAFVILNVQLNIMKDAQRMFTIFEKQFRDLGAQLRVCIEDQEIREVLVKSGIIREDELRKDLKETLVEASTALKGK